MDERPPLSPKLTRREQQVARLIHAGFNSFEIRSLLEIDVQTLKNIVCTINKKLQTHSREEIARMVEINWGWFLFAHLSRNWNRSKVEATMKPLSRPSDDVESPY